MRQPGKSSSSGPLVDYTAFARTIYETGVLSDPWFDGVERFGLEGVVLSPRLANSLAVAAERVAYLHEELVRILLDEPTLLTEFYHLTPCQYAMWQAAGGLWHGIARADLFLCQDGRIACCELNSDTPSGQPEAVILNQLLQPRHGDVDDPNAGLERRFIAMLRESHAKRTDKPLTSVGIIYPTELTEDLSMITLFTQWLEASGIAVVHGSPYNVHRTRRGIAVLGEPVDLVIRHYKTDWWGERLPVWDDAPDYLDPDPLDEPLRALLTADICGEVTIVNPFGAVITQNKLSLAFFWEEQHRFSRRSQHWIRQYIPQTYRMTSLSPDRLRAERTQWVLKSDYGCEGEETICGPFVSDELWQKTIDHALPERFVAQRFFHAQPDPMGRLTNYGVFLIGGTASGFFTRLSPQSTQYTALTVPTFVAR